MELEDPRLWVAAAFVIFIALVYKKVGTILGKSLDERSAKIKSELDQARSLREEAAAVLAQYKQKQAEYLKEAESILLDARKDAAILTTHAEQELKASLDARTKQALERIEREESKAIEDVRNHVVDISLAAARTLITEQMGSMSEDEIVQLALADIERKIH